MATKYAYTADALLDLHKRTHTSLKKLLKHCGELSDKQLNKKLKGFGFPTVHAQLFHLIAAEYYWISVAKGDMDVNLNPADHPTVKDLQRFRLKTAKVTAAYLDKTSNKVLNTPRKVLTYGDKQTNLMPAHVVLRTQTHAFQHQGQILAMCRIMDHPGPKGLDLLIKP